MRAAWMVWMVFTLACADRALPDDADVCERADYLVASCGVVLPTLQDSPCTGGARILATCVVNHAHDCDQLATLNRRLDQCKDDLLDGGGLIAPPADLPVPAPRDGDGGS